MLFIAAIAISCGEAGLQINVAKDVPYDFNVEAEDVNISLEYNGIVDVDLGNQELGEYNLNDLDMNLISYEIFGLPEGQSFGSFSMIVRANASTLIEIPRLTLANTSSPATIYPGGVNVDLNTVELIRQEVIQGRQFAMENNARFEAEVPNDFVIRFNFDVLGKVRD